MRTINSWVGCVWLAAVAGALAQAQPPVPAPPPLPQNIPMAFRPIRVPQLAPIPAPQTAPDVQIPLARPEPVQAQAQRAPQVLMPPGVTPRPGQPFPFNPGLPPMHQPQPLTLNPPLHPPSYLVFDAERKETNAAPGQVTVPFTFWLTNVSRVVVSINSVRTSCGCTVAQLPAQPWLLQPGSSGPIHVTMNLAGKMGSIEKSVTIDSSTGYRNLIVKANLPQPANAQPVAGGIDLDRLKNMQMALADRQVVFKGECAKCHSEPAEGKAGEQLYVAACGICHDSAHRAAMVPDLKTLKHPTNEEHWRKWIKSGRPGSMMPAFAKAEGGPLSDEQIDSLIKFLTETITARAQQPPVAKSAQLSDPAQPAIGAFPLPKANVQ
ncbi:MAG: DUF1573 domain-containing protein [Verrucomicrobia subdivision 3 bacterium]|nr:DUF1573 domain-containing protein [Limisphaerales bacterium]